MPDHVPTDPEAAERRLAYDSAEEIDVRRPSLESLGRERVKLVLPIVLLL